MTLHLIKLSVGTDDIDDLQTWIDQGLADKRRRGLEPVHIHRTRMFPKRRDEILDGGSIYWVIKGVAQVREPILDLRPSVDSGGIPHCDIVLSGVLHKVVPQTWRPFQGWRYLDAERAPPDISAGAAGLPPQFARELAELGLL